MFAYLRAYRSGLPWFLLLLLSAGNAHAQGPSTKTIEGYWQDIERRILFSRDAPPGYVFGRWTMIDQEQTYPSVKDIRRSNGALEVVDLNYDDANYEVTTVQDTPDGVVFVRKVKWTGCAMHHRCRLDGEQMFCSLENVCPQGGNQVIDWRGEERYVQIGRAHV